MKVDLADGWDFWPFMPLPLKEARARIGVPPPAKEYRTGPGIMPPPIGRWD